MKETPYLTADFPGTGGIIKQSPEDFVVEEIPLYLPCGEGEHLYVTFEKRGITTLEAVRRLSRDLGIPEREIGYAGMKDSVGVTRQTVSMPRVEPERALAAEIPGMRVLSAVRHRNKLRLGHLAGNRFTILVRGVVPEALSRAEEVLRVLSTRGVPNFFGEQRYGGIGNSHLIGAALLRRDWRGAVEALIGDPERVRDERWREAIISFREGRIEEAAKLMPGGCRTERELLERLSKRPDDFERALKGVHPRLKRLYLSACQSSLFDRVLAERLDTFDSVDVGDIAFLHANGACFLVEDAAAEGPRAAAGEISPTGPLFGCRMKEPAGEELLLEERVLAESGLTRAEFDLPGDLRLEGERRPLRVLLGASTVTSSDEGLLVGFSLPKGSYATVVLREIMKTSAE
jgi:tRNA pseudouridine13 synthase